jgi:hypothetical protein
LESLRAGTARIDEQHAIVPSDRGPMRMPTAHRGEPPSCTNIRQRLSIRTLQNLRDCPLGALGIPGGLFL